MPWGHLQRRQLICSMRFLGSEECTANRRSYMYIKDSPDLSFFCVCYAPDLVGALTGIRVNSVSRWHHWFPRRYSQEGRARVDPGFVNADAILHLMLNYYYFLQIQLSLTLRFLHQSIFHSHS